MKKTLSSVGLAIAVATATLLTGCQLYFNDKDHDRSSNTVDPPGPPPAGGTTAPGFACTSNANCAAGCFCADGTCTEAGFCSTDKDCGDGFTCDTARSSCEPAPPAPAVTCAGEAASTCTTAAPGCPAGQVATLQDGCFTGACGDIATCDAAPACDALQHEADCKARTTDCAEVFVGRNCTGTTCGVSADDCTCEAYTYAACDAATSTASRLLIDN